MAGDLRAKRFPLPLRKGDKLIVEGVDKAKPGALVKPVAVKAN